MYAVQGNLRVEEETREKSSLKLSLGHDDALHLFKVNLFFLWINPQQADVPMEPKGTRQSRTLQWLHKQPPDSQLDEMKRLSSGLDTPNFQRISEFGRKLTAVPVKRTVRSPNEHLL